MQVNCLSVTVVYSCTGYLLSAAFCRISRFTASSGVTFFCFVTLFTPLSRIISDLPLFFSDDQINIRLSHLLSSMHNRLPYRFNVLFSIFSRTVSHSRLFLITSFVTLKFWMFLQLLSKRSLLYLTAFPLICNPLSKFISLYHPVEYSFSCIQLYIFTTK